MTLRIVLLRDRSGRAGGNIDEKDSPDRGVGAAELAMELTEVMVFVRLELALEGTGGSGMARRVELLAISRIIVAPRIRLLEMGGFDCVGVTVLLLQAVDALAGSLGATLCSTLKPRTVQRFLASTMDA